MRLTALGPHAAGRYVPSVRQTAGAAVAVSDVEEHDPI